MNGDETWKITQHRNLQKLGLKGFNSKPLKNGPERFQFETLREIGPCFNLFLRKPTIYCCAASDKDPSLKTHIFMFRWLLV